jgi:hypothetical protein
MGPGLRSRSWERPDCIKCMTQMPSLPGTPKLQHLATRCTAGESIRGEAKPFFFWNWDMESNCKALATLQRSSRKAVIWQSRLWVALEQQQVPHCVFRTLDCSVSQKGHVLNVSEGVEHGHLFHDCSRVPYENGRVFVLRYRKLCTL